MKAKHFLAAALVGASSLTAAIVAPPAAYAQSNTTGAIQGVVKDATNGEPLVGVTVVVAGPTMAPQTVITDENGFYKVTELPPGSNYIVTFYYISVVLERRDISVGVNKVAPVYVKIDPNESTGGETIVVVDSVPTIDPTSTTQGITLDQDYLDKIPVPGRTFESALGAAAGSQSDGLGVAFSGSTSLETRTSSTASTDEPAVRHVGHPGDQRLHRRDPGHPRRVPRPSSAGATGGVVNVLTKSRPTKIAASVFGAFTSTFHRRSDRRVQAS